MSLLESALSHIGDRKLRGQLCAAAGMVSLVTGNKFTALGLFTAGLRDLEAEWRAAHPDFQGGPLERWRAAIEFYEKTHAQPTNRALHVVGIPIIVGGTTGLIIFPRYTPPWFLSAGAFVGGWTLNFIGHGIFERNRPAFADDPLSFVAGPAWDLLHLKDVLRRDRTPATAGGAAT